MAVDTTTMREARHKLVLEARKLIDGAETEKRSMTAEERSQYDKMMEDAETTRNKVLDVERRNNLERVEAENKLREDEESAKKQKDDAETTTLKPTGTEEYRTAFRAWLRNGEVGLPIEHQRALSAGKSTEGNFLYPDEQFVDELIANVTDATIVRGLARQFTVTGADSLGVPTLTRMGAANWGSELGVPTRDTTMAVGKRALTPHPQAIELPVSKTLLRRVPNVAGLVNSELARVKGELEENAYMTGNGAQKPLGLFTASSDGISTSRDVSTGNTTTSMTFDGLKSAKYTLKGQYWGAASWIMHRDGMQQIAKLKDGNGRYLLQDSVVQGEPDRLIGFPVLLSEFAPNTFTTGLYTAIFGDFSWYWIVDTTPIQLARAEELLIRDNQDLFVMRADTDGAPVKEEAFVRVKLA